jgi:hypothetical protein
MHGVEEHGGSSTTIGLQSRYGSVDQILLHGEEISQSRVLGNRRSLTETVPLKMNGRGGESR